VDHRLRRTTLAEGLGVRGVDALLVSALPNVRYLSGFTGSNAQVVVGTDAAVFLTDGRYTEQSRHEVPDMERVTYLGAAEPALLEAARGMGVSRLGFEADDVSVAALARLAEGLDGIELVPTEGIVGRQRWVKDAEEIQALREAQAATDAAFDDLLEVLAVGVSEREVAWELEKLLRRDGADALSFDSIVAFGEHAAEPHHQPTDRRLEEGDVIKLDFGALSRGYHADMTRTIAFGQPATELRKVHDVVREAQQAGIDAIRAGVTGAEVDAAARGVVEAAGYGDAFSHGLGHGVGLEIHEGPRLGKEFEGHELPVGAVVTVEPGVYLPGLGGVRIEDMVEVTAEGGEVLGTASRDMIEL
jgi:Xaa-Pro aminopeptidase